MPTVSFLGVAHIHMPGFTRMLAARPDIRVAAVWDADPARRAHWAEALSAAEAASVDEAVAAADATVIASQTGGHAALVAKAAAAGRAVFVEKPIGVGAADAYAMAAQIEQAAVVFQTGYFMRSDPMLRRIKQRVDAGDLGLVTKAAASNCHSGALGDWFKAKPDLPGEDWHWMTEAPHAGVGAFGDIGTHALDILIWWLGDVKTVTAQIDPVTDRYGCDESGQGLLRFDNRATATLTAGWVDVADPVSYLVSGTEGHAAVIDGKLYVTRDGKFDSSKPETDLPPAAPHAFALFLDAITGRTPAVPLVSVREAAYRSAVMEAMYVGAREGRWTVPSPGMAGRGLG